MISLVSRAEAVDHARVGHVRAMCGGERLAGLRALDIAAHEGGQAGLLAFGQVLACVWMRAMAPKAFLTSYWRIAATVRRRPAAACVASGAAEVRRAAVTAAVVSGVGCAADGAGSWVLTAAVGAAGSNASCCCHQLHLLCDHLLQRASRRQRCPPVPASPRLRNRHRATAGATWAAAVAAAAVGAGRLGRHRLGRQVASR